MTIYDEYGFPLPASAVEHHTSGLEIWYAEDEVLTTTEDLERTRQELEARGLRVQDVTPLPDLGVEKVLVERPPAGGPPLHDVVDEIVDDVSPTITVRLNHYLYAMSHIHVWPGCLATARSEPAPIDPDRSRGAGQLVVVLDTGIQHQPWFGDSVDARSDPEEREAVTTANGPYLSPLWGHGTFAAGVVHAHAPGATIVVERLRLRHSMAKADEVALQIAALAGAGPDVVNLSWGSYSHRNLGTLAVERAVARLLELSPKTAVVAAAGNDGVDVPTWPAAAKAVVAVGATGPDGRPARVHTDCQPPFDHWGSNFGDWVDLYAPGVDVAGPFAVPTKTDLPTLAGGDAGQFASGSATWGGTSFAAPFVAAQIAVDAAARGVTAAEAARA
ncbi:MAG TPA: S8/S53 family peptidase, partial [Acidimicrobiales bacterium]